MYVSPSRTYFSLLIILICYNLYVLIQDFLFLQASGNSPLHVACEMQDFDMVQMLVEKGADVSATDGRGLTVLHHQVTLQTPSIVTYLLHNGLSVDIKHEVRTKLYPSIVTKLGCPSIVTTIGE